jgi:tape measure domain-containing protein
MTSNFTALGEQMTRSITLPIVGLGAAAVKSAADLETLETSFISLTGGAEQAANMVAQLNEFTAKTPFQLEEVGKAARQLIASGTAVGEVSDQLQFLGDIAATSGSSIEEIAAIFAKVNAKGKVELENLNQLAERGIPIFKALADATGLPADKLGAGRVSVEQFNEVLKSFAEEGGFAAGAMERLSQTAAGKFSTALDNAKLALASMGENALPLVNEALERMTVLFQGVAKLTPETLKLAGGVGALAAALGPLLVSLPKIIAGVDALKMSFKLTAPAVLAVSTVLGTVIGLFMRVKKEASKSAESVKEVQRALDELTESELRREAGVSKFAKRESINEAVAQSLKRVAEANRELESIEERIKQGGPGLRAIYRNRIIDLQNYRDEFQRSADAGQLLLEFIDKQKKKLDELGASTLTVANLFAMLEHWQRKTASSMGKFFSAQENVIVPAFETMITKTSQLLDFLERVDTQNNKVTQGFIRFGEVVGFAFAEAAAEAQSSSQTFVVLFKRLATGAIKAARAQVAANAAVIASKSGPAAPVVFASTLALMEGLINSIPMPQFAQGGMVFGPTAAIVGDNMNARIDPEVIAPLSKLKDMLGGNQVQVVGRISGQDIWLANDRATRERNRIG